MWPADYLGTFQKRTKWLIDKYNISLGMIVHVKYLFPVCKWFLGRVVKVYYDPENKMNIVKIKTKSSDFKRWITKIEVLPVK